MTMSHAPRKLPGRTLSTVWRKRALYSMLIPGIIYFVCFKYLPMYGTIISFKAFSVKKGIWFSPWANPWYRYFEQFFTSPYFSQILGNTLIISLTKLAVSVPVSILFAIALCEVRSARYRRLVQTVTYLPHFLSWVIVYGILHALFSESIGIVNQLIKMATGSTYNFLSSTANFRGLIVITDIWKETGWAAIIYISAIVGIDMSLYEAARMDGAGRLRSIWHVTLPGIRSVTVVLLLLRVGTVFDAGFDQIFVMSNDRVLSVADIIDTWVYRTGMKQWNFGLASAVGLFKSVIGTVLMVLMNTVARRWGESLW